MRRVPDRATTARVLPFEGLVIAYLTFFALVTPLASVERRRWIGAALVAVVSAVAVYLASRTLPIAVRLWLPFLYTGAVQKAGRGLIVGIARRNS